MSTMKQRKNGNLPEDLVKRQLKFGAWFSLAWFVVMSFSMIGIVAGHENAVYLAISTAVMWVVGQIIIDAINGWFVLSVLSKKQDDDNYDQ